jgi:hypothetical protein
MSYCIISGGNVYHPSYIGRSSFVGGLPISEHAGYSPFGYVIPLSPEGYNVLDYLETGTVHGEFLSIVIDCTGNVYEFIGSGGGCKRSRLPFNHLTTTYVKGGLFDIEKAILTGLHLKHPPLDILNTIQSYRVHERHTFANPLVIPFETILSNLRKLSPKKNCVPIPVKQNK